MNLEKLSTTLAITANFGVLLGLVLVAWELRQNDHTLNASIQLSLSNSYEELATMPFEYPLLGEAIAVTVADADALTSEQFMAVMSWQYRNQLVVYTTYNLYVEGIIDEALWRERASQFVVFLKIPAMRRIYEEAQHDELFSPEFQAALMSLLDEMLENDAGETTP